MSCPPADNRNTNFIFSPFKTKIIFPFSFRETVIWFHVWHANSLYKLIFIAAGATVYSMNIFLLKGIGLKRLDILAYLFTDSMDWTIITHSSLSHRVSITAVGFFKKHFNYFLCWWKVFDWQLWKKVFDWQSTKLPHQSASILAWRDSSSEVRRYHMHQLIEILGLSAEMANKANLCAGFTAYAGWWSPWGCLWGK